MYVDMTSLNYSVVKVFMAQAFNYLTPGAPSTGLPRDGYAGMSRVISHINISYLSIPFIS